MAPKHIGDDDNQLKTLISNTVVIYVNKVVKQQETLSLGTLNLAVRLGLKRLSGVVWVSQRFSAGLPKGRA